MRFIIACSVLLVAVRGSDGMSQRQIMQCAMTAMAPKVQQHCQQELTSNPVFLQLLQSGKPTCEVMIEATDMSYNCISAQIKSKPKCNDPAIDPVLKEGRVIAMDMIKSIYCAGTATENSVKRSMDDLEAAHIAEIAVNTVATNI
ncbi:unnamed protein product [Owenia fusiformis]|uniref:Uncharacterized protein n=1 Tax=Owenia fusiformis TaxID=6347 RepID=A0A8J1T4B9_OWEFU|nr:unnamed protein product [Owenia fusiformis]